MISVDPKEISDLVQRVQGWPPSVRIALARQILETLETPALETRLAERPRGLSSAEIAARFRTDKPAPDDATVKRWIEEHRMEKYGK
jgi:hypothetical protein